MERFFSKIKKETLSKDEKEKIFSALETYVHQNPIRRIKSPFYSEWFVLARKAATAPAILAVVIVLAGGGTVLASRNSLPGDTLYPVKTAGEKVRLFTAVGPKAQAEISTSQAISRLEEVEQIVSLKKDFSSSTRQEIQNKFEAQTQEVINNINELKKNGRGGDAAKINSDLESSLNKHKKTFVKFLNSSSTASSTKEALTNFVSNIDSQIEKTKNDRHSKSFPKSFREKMR